MTDAVLLPADLRRWLAEHLPAVATVTDASWPRPQSRVWRVENPTTTAYLKVSPSEQNYTRETAAYRKAADSLGRDRSPRLIATDPALRAILTMALAGAPVRELPLSPSEKATVHRHAGQLLRRWHDHPAHVRPRARDEVRTAMAAHVREAVACLGALGGLLTDTERDLLGTAARDLPALAPRLPLTCTHGDFSPRNWIWDPQRKTLGLIDFEAAGHGLAVQDLVWLFGAVWPTRHDLRRSFLDGFGREPAADEHQVLVLLTTRLAASYLATGIASNEQALIERGRTALADLARTYA